MATSTAQNVIEKAMQKIGVLASGESASADMLADGLDSLNLLISSLAADGLMNTALIQNNFTLVSGTPTYSIGSGLTFDSSKPLSVESAFVRDASGFDYTVGIISRGVYDSYLDKDATGRPQTLFYDPGASQQATQTGTIKLYPAPDAAYTLFLTSEKPFTEFSALSDAVTFHPAQKRALIFGLAVEIAPDYGRQIPAELVASAQEARSILENLNSRNRTVVSRVGLPGVGSAYNIFADE